VPQYGLVIACPAERFFGDIKAQAAHLVGIDNVLTYDTYDELRATVSRALARGGYEFILIAGHGQMNEQTGAGVMLSRLTPLQWTQIVNSMTARHMTAPVVILDGCKSASFLTIFTNLVQGNGYVVCNVGDSSTTVFGQLEPARTLADAIEAKRQIELAIRPRPGRPLIAAVPADASEFSEGQILQWTGTEWRFLDYPTLTIAAVGDGKLTTWLATGTNSADLRAAALRQQAQLPALSATLFVPTAVYTAQDHRLRISGPFASYPDDLVTAYEHWQRFGPGGEALMVERQEIWRLMEVLDVAGITTLDTGLAATVAAIPGQVNSMVPLPMRPGITTPRRRPTRKPWKQDRRGPPPEHQGRLRGRLLSPRAWRAGRYRGR